MNKTTTTWTNYVIGAMLTIVLFWFIYQKVYTQVSKLDSATWQHTGPVIYLLISILLMFLNVYLETFKWFLLVNFVEPVGIYRILKSYLAGVAFSIITPSGIGEYPGRILYLGGKQALRYANISILGITAQFLTVFIFGFAALIITAFKYNNLSFPAFWVNLAICVSIVASISLVMIYLKFETWLEELEKIKFLKKFVGYGRLLSTIPLKKQLAVLAISMLRFAIYTTQYLFLLSWMNVSLPFGAGICLAILFFCTITAIPSIAFSELLTRGGVAVVIFGYNHYSTNTIGILAATTGIWLLNVVLPATIGSLLLFRMKLLK